MTPEQWMNQYLNQGINIDGAYGNQCWDWANFYIINYLGAPRINGNAITFLDNVNGAIYERILNSPSNHPVEGDVVVWNYQPYGHVAICSYASDNSSFTSYDQNYPSQGYYDQYGNFIGTGVVHRQWHNYDHVAGWLRPRVLHLPPTTTTTVPPKPTTTTTAPPPTTTTTVTTSTSTSSTTTTTVPPINKPSFIESIIKLINQIINWLKGTK